MGKCARSLPQAGYRLRSLATDPLPAAVANPAQSEKRNCNSPLTSESMAGMRARLEQHPITQQSYPAPGLSPKSLSDEISFGPHALSQLINNTFGMNYFDYPDGGFDAAKPVQWVTIH